MTTYKYQEQFASDLVDAWIYGKREHVCTTIRSLKNKAQAAYIAAEVAIRLHDCSEWRDKDEATHFISFMHPNK